MTKGCCVHIFPAVQCCHCCLAGNTKTLQYLPLATSISMFHSKAHLSHSGRKKKKKKIYDGTVIEISPKACLAPMKYFSSDSIPSVH